MTAKRRWARSALEAAFWIVVLGFLAIAATAFGLLDAVSSLHVLTVGCIGTMTLAVMWRIHWQALRLWRKSVRFHRKPAPPPELVSR